VLDALLLSLHAPHIVLDGLVLGLGFHGEVNLALRHHKFGGLAFFALVAKLVNK